VVVQHLTEHSESVSRMIRRTLSFPDECSVGTCEYCRKSMVVKILFAPICYVIAVSAQLYPHPRFPSFTALTSY